MTDKKKLKTKDTLIAEIDTFLSTTPQDKLDDVVLESLTRKLIQILAATSENPGKWQDIAP